MSHQVVQLANGQWSLRSLDVEETYHPVVGPESESDVLYAQQIQLERVLTTSTFVVWDVGLGGAANAIAVINAASQYNGKLKIYSFEHDLEPLNTALNNIDKLHYLIPYQDILTELLHQRKIQFTNNSIQIDWEIVYGDFPSWLTNQKDSSSDIQQPHAILYDAFSPKKNPDMYTLDIFRKLHRLLNNSAPCILVSYSRATLLRVTLLLAGFYVGKGAATGEKEETTIASNKLDILSKPLSKEWLGRVQRSNSAEPLHTPKYIQQPLTQDSWKQLLSHPQFSN